MNSIPNTIQSAIILILTVAFGGAVILALHTFAADWAIENRNLIPPLFGGIVLAPWIIVFVRCRRP